MLLYITHLNLEELEEIELGEPCQLFKSNERNKNCALKLTIFYLFGHKLSWATAPLSGAMNVRCIPLHLTK